MSESWKTLDIRLEPRGLMFQQINGSVVIQRGHHTMTCESNKLDR